MEVKSVTNNLIKYIASLSRKKQREEENCFVVEGTKCVRDTWEYFNCRMIIATRTWYEQIVNRCNACLN